MRLACKQCPLALPGTACGRVYELYGDYVMKNPFHEMDQVRCARCTGLLGTLGADRAPNTHPVLAPPACLPAQVIKSELFDQSLIQAISAINRRYQPA